MSPHFIFLAEVAIFELLTDESANGFVSTTHDDSRKWFMYPGNLTKNQIVLFLNAVGARFHRFIFSHFLFRKTVVLSLILTSLLLPRAVSAQFLLSTNMKTVGHNY